MSLGEELKIFRVPFILFWNARVEDLSLYFRGFEGSLAVITLNSLRDKGLRLRALDFRHGVACG